MVIVVVVLLLTAVSAIAQSPSGPPPTDPRDTPKGPRQIFPVAPRAGTVRAAPANDNFANATAVTLPLPYSNNVLDFDLASPDIEAGEIKSCFSDGMSIWYTLTPAANMAITLDTEGSSFDSVLSIYTGAALGSLTELACNDDLSFVLPAGLTSSIIGLNVTKDTIYHIRVAALDNDGLISGSGENATLNIKVTPPAGNFTVNSTVDAADTSAGDGVCAASGGACTLRAAVIEANASLPGTEITLPAGVFTLSQTGFSEDAAVKGDLDVRTDVTIVGAGALATVIDGGDIDSVMEFVNNAAVTLTGVTIRNGRRVGYSAGGGLRVNSAAVTLNQVWVTGNEAGFGGGITVEGGTLTASDSAITNNVATGVLAESGNGGGIEVRDGIGNVVAINLTNVTISGNSTVSAANVPASKGGGVYFGPPSALITVTVALNNVTLAANTSSNGGGIFVADSVSILVSNTLIGDNIATTNPDCRGNIGSQGSNLIENTAGCTMTGSNIVNQDAQLSGLSLNAPGNTPTHLPRAASPARNAVNASGCAPADQRGISRATNGTCDVGALEALNTVPGAFALLTPANDFIVTSATALQQFTWQESAGALTYAVFLDSGVNGTWTNVFSTSVTGASVCSASVCTASFSNPLPDGFYRYRVIAYADTNETAAVSSHIVQVNSVVGLPNLLTNGGFETKSVNGQALKWNAKGISGDKRKCNTDTVIYSYKENCAYRFKGTKLENSSIRQRLDLNGLVLAKDNSFRFSFYANYSASIKAVVMMKVVYKKTSIKPSKFKLVLPAGDQTWMPLSGEVILKNRKVDRVILILKHTAKSGTWLVDDVRAVYLNGTTTARQDGAATRDVQHGGLLPPPAAPDGFRGNN